MRPGWLLALCPLALNACTGGRTPRIAHDVDVTPLRRSVSAVRGLAELRHTPVDVVDDRTFVRLLSSGADSDRGAGGTPLGEAAAAVAAQRRSVELEDTLGYYDIEKHTIVLREPSSDDRERLPMSWVLAHELTHALQHQHFQIADMSTLATADEQLAYAALLEGDAMVTMLAQGAEEGFVPIPRALAIATRNIQRGEADRIEQFGAPPKKSDSVSPLVRARVEFPYSAGTVFVAAAHRTGGFRLIDQMYAHPPRTTEQILHPEKYFAGEGPVEVAAPAPPTGFSVGARGRMGELGIVGMLESCVGSEQARAAAAGWGGDAFIVVERAGTSPVVLWSTAWDSPTDAAEFAGAARRCDDTSGAGQVVHDGYRVSVITGSFGRQAPAVHRYLLGLSAWRAPASPPLSVSQVTPLPPLPPVAPATLSAERYDSPRLDLALPVPPGFQASLVDGALLLKSERALMEVDFSPALVTTESTAKVYRDFVRSLGVPASDLSVDSNDRTQTPVGEGLERTWSIAGTSIRLQVLVLPVCGGNGSVTFKRLWSDPHSGRLLDWVVQSARRLRGGTPPVCAELV